MKTDIYLKKFYENRAFFVEKYHVFLIPKTLEMIDGIKAKKVLDVGCGGGEITEIIAKKVRAKKVVGVDISSKQLKTASKRGIETVQVDLNKEKIPLKEKFDLVICLNFLEHILNPDHVLNEIYRLSKSKQVFMIPNFAAWYNRISLLLGWQPFNIDTTLEFKGYNPFFRYKEPYGHIRLFTKNSARELLIRHGFSIIKFDGTMLGQESWIRNLAEKIFSPTVGLKSILIFLTKKV
jgi:methionine biosynthesis protein MetW